MLSVYPAFFNTNLKDAIVICFNLTDETYFADFKAPSVSKNDFRSLWLVRSISNVAAFLGIYIIILIR